MAVLWTPYCVVPGGLLVTSNLILWLPFAASLTANTKLIRDAPIVLTIPSSCLDSKQLWVGVHSVLNTTVK